MHYQVSSWILMLCLGVISSEHHGSAQVAVAFRLADSSACSWVRGMGYQMSPGNNGSPDVCHAFDISAKKNLLCLESGLCNVIA